MSRNSKRDQIKKFLDDNLSTIENNLCRWGKEVFKNVEWMIWNAFFWTLSPSIQGMRGKEPFRSMKPDANGSKMMNSAFYLF